MTIALPQAYHDNQLETIQRLLKQAPRHDPSTPDALLSVLLSHVTEPATDGQVSASIVILNKLFRFNRMTCRGLLRDHQPNALLLEASREVFDLAQSLPNARKSCWLSLQNKIGEFLLFHRRDVEGAMPYFQQALTMAHWSCPKEMHFDRARALSNLGFIVLKRKQYDLAREYFGEASALYKEGRKGRSLGLAFCHHCMGAVEREQKNYGPAVVLLTKGLKILEAAKIKGPHFAQPLLFYTMGSVFRSMNQQVQADRCMGKTVEALRALQFTQGAVDRMRESYGV